MSEEQARQVGVLAGQASFSDVVDVTVVEGARRRQDTIVTSDQEHITHIALAANAQLRIEAI
ncbi:MAG: hypothetical protein ACREN8_03080 [Candidatus Dormibacteraceae bacterium]